MHLSPRACTPNADILAIILPVDVSSSKVSYVNMSLYTFWQGSMVCMPASSQNAPCQRVCMINKGLLPPERSPGCRPTNMQHLGVLQVVMAPHVYPPSISEVEGGPTTLGSVLYKRLSE